MYVIPGVRWLHPIDCISLIVLLAFILMLCTCSVWFYVFFISTTVHANHVYLSCTSHTHTHRARGCHCSWYLYTAPHRTTCIRTPHLSRCFKSTIHNGPYEPRAHAGCSNTPQFKFKCQCEPCTRVGYPASTPTTRLRNRGGTTAQFSYRIEVTVKASQRRSCPVYR